MLRAPHSDIHCKNVRWSKGIWARCSDATVAQMSQCFRSLVLAVFRYDEKPMRRVAALGGLARLGDSSAVRELITILEGRKPGLCGEAARYLGHVRDKTVVSCLITQIPHLKGFDKALAINALGGLADVRSIPILIELLSSDEHYSEPG